MFQASAQFQDSLNCQAASRQACIMLKKSLELLIGFPIQPLHNAIPKTMTQGKGDS